MARIDLSSMGDLEDLEPGMYTDDAYDMIQEIYSAADRLLDWEQDFLDSLETFCVESENEISDAQAGTLNEIYERRVGG